MKYTVIRDEILQNPMFHSHGGRRAGMSLPLLNRVGSKEYVVVMLYLEEPGVPDAFAVYDLAGKELRILENEEAFRVFELPETLFFVRDDGDTGKTAADLPEDVFDLFDRVIEKKKVSEEAYKQYFYQIYPCMRPEARPFYLAFAPRAGEEA